MRKTIKFFFTRVYTITSIVLFALSYGAIQAYAVYYPTDNITNPSCAPGDSGCYVSLLPDQTSNSGSLLFTNGTNPSWTSSSALSWDSVNGRLGVGTSVPGYSLDVNGRINSSNTGTNTSLIGLSYNGVNTITVNGTAYSRGLNLAPLITIASGITSSGSLHGATIYSMRNYLTNNDSGTLSNIFGAELSYGTYNSDGTATPITTNAYGIRINPFFRTGVTTNSYDIYLGAISGSGTVTNQWGIYQANTKSNYFSGNIGISTTSPVSKLQIGSSPSASANYGTISLGGGAFDGTTSGYFGTSSSSNSNGTSLAINEASGYTGDLMNLQKAGVSAFKVDSLGNTTITNTDDSTSNPGFIVQNLRAGALNGRFNSFNSQDTGINTSNVGFFSQYKKITNSTTGSAIAFQLYSDAGNNGENITVATQYNMQLYTRNRTINAVTNQYGLYLSNQNTSSGSVVNSYGIYIAGMPTVTGTSYALYNSTTAPSYFGGNVAIGAIPSTSHFLVSGAGIGGGSTAVFTESDSNTTLGSNSPNLMIYNTSSTTNNWNEIGFGSAGGSITSMIASQTTNHASNYGDLSFSTRGAGGYGERMRIDSNGNVSIGTAGASLTVGTFNSVSSLYLGSSSGNARISSSGYDISLIPRAGGQPVNIYYDGGTAPAATFNASGIPRFMPSMQSQTVAAWGRNGIFYSTANNVNADLLTAATITDSSAGGATNAYAAFNSFSRPTLTATNAINTTDVMNVYVAGVLRGANQTITNTHGLYIDSTAVGAATNSYGLTVNTMTGATNNYAAQFLGGNVGIGISSPLYKLHVEQSSNAGGNPFVYFKVANTDGAILRLANLDGGTSIIENNDTFQIQKNSVFVFAANPAGNVGIGNSTPSYQLHVGSASVTGIVSRFQNSTGTCDINPTTTSLSCSSDINLKKNISTLKDNQPFILNTQTPDTNVLTNLNKLTPVVYNWTTEQDTDTKHPGFIAQDVEAIFPNLVSTDPNTNLKSLNYIGLIPYAIEGIKELDIKLNQQASLDTTLQGSFAFLLKEVLGNVSNGINELYVKVVKSDRVETKELCTTDGICLSENDIKNLYQISQERNQTNPQVAPQNPPAPENSPVEELPPQENIEEIVE